MDEDICPASKAVFRGILPCLKARAMNQIVKRLPVIEGFVAVLDWSI